MVAIKIRNTTEDYSALFGCIKFLTLRIFWRTLLMWQPGEGLSTVLAFIVHFTNMNLMMWVETWRPSRQLVRHCIHRDSRVTSVMYNKEWMINKTFWTLVTFVWWLLSNFPFKVWGTFKGISYSSQVWCFSPGQILLRAVMMNDNIHYILHMCLAGLYNWFFCVGKVWMISKALPHFPHIKGFYSKWKFWYLLWYQEVKIFYEHFKTCTISPQYEVPCVEKYWSAY